MPNDINELDVNDIGLKMVMGDRFQDETSDSEVKYDVQRPLKAAAKIAKKELDAQWEPVSQKSFTQKLMACGKKAAVYAGLCLLISYWQSTGQMEASAAMPCMMACTALIGVTYGRVFAKEMF
jgi:hypothetical protein